MFVCCVQFYPENLIYIQTRPDSETWRLKSIIAARKQCMVEQDVCVLCSIVSDERKIHTKPLAGEIDGSVASKVLDTSAWSNTAGGCCVPSYPTTVKSRVRNSILVGRIITARQQNVVGYCICVVSQLLTDRRESGQYSSKGLGTMASWRFASSPQLNWIFVCCFRWRTARIRHKLSRTGKFVPKPRLSTFTHQAV